MSSLIVLLGWLFDALSLKSWSDIIFARFAGPSDGDYPVHRAIWFLCGEGRYEDARRLASSRWEWTKSPRTGRDFIHILLRLGEVKRAIEIADQMAAQDTANPWLMILAADLRRFFAKDEDKALAVYLDAVTPSEALLPLAQAAAVVYERIASIYRKRGDTSSLTAWQEKLREVSPSAQSDEGLAGALQETDGVRLIPVTTGILTEALGPVETVAKYAGRRVRPGDSVTLSACAAAAMEGRVLMTGAVRLSALARFLAKHVPPMSPMPPMPDASALAIQAALEETGTLRFIAAALAGGAGRLLKKEGWFQVVAGARVAQITGLPASMAPYDYYVAVAPWDASALSSEISAALVEGVGAAVVGSRENVTPIVIRRPVKKTEPQVTEEGEDGQPEEPDLQRAMLAVAKGLAWAAAAVSVAGESVARYGRTALSDPRTRKVVIGALLVVVLGTPAVAWLDRPVPVDVPVPVLLYHDLTSDAVSRNGMIVPIHEFRMQMALLRECGYVAITASQLAAHLTGQETLPSRPVLITFDDGYESVYTLAYPVLREFGLRATAFVVGTTLRTENHLTFEQMREMSQAGVVEIGSHTYAGHGGDSAAPDIASWTEEQVMADLSTLTAVLRAEKVPMAPAFAYPFGDPSASLLRAVRKLGFAIAFTTENGMASRTLSLLNQRRVTVWPGGDGALFLRKIEPSFWLEDEEEREAPGDVALSR